MHIQYAVWCHGSGEALDLAISFLWRTSEKGLAQDNWCPTPPIQAPAPLSPLLRTYCLFGSRCRGASSNHALGHWMGSTIHLLIVFLAAHGAGRLGAGLAFGVDSPLNRGGTHDTDLSALPVGIAAPGDQMEQGVCTHLLCVQWQASCCHCPLSLTIKHTSIQSPAPCGSPAVRTNTGLPNILVRAGGKHLLCSACFDVLPSNKRQPALAATLLCTDRQSTGFPLQGVWGWQSTNEQGGTIHTHSCQPLRALPSYL